MPLKRINVLTGPNACGKSNLYHSISLLFKAANGGLARAIAAEGGMESVFWAGAHSGKKKIELDLQIDDFRFQLRIGKVGAMAGSRFSLDPAIEEEIITDLTERKPVKIAERGRGTCYVRDREGIRQSYHLQLEPEESVLSQISDPFQYPHLSFVRRVIGKWRFYHQFRTDADSPLRKPQIPSRTPIMAPDGSDVALALQTIIENGDDQALDTAVKEALDGARLVIIGGDDGLSVGLDVRGIARTLTAHELSDGTLRYLCLLGALLSPSAAPLLALNEPESSLHPQVLKPLAKLIVAASERSQIWLTTHSARLADAISAQSGVKAIELVKVNGETMRAGRTDPRVYYSSEPDE